MNRLILIGNGFDLAHGLKTSYKDFISHYLAKCINAFYNNQSYQDELININNRGYTLPSKKVGNQFEEIQKEIEFLKRNQLGHLTYKSIFFKNLIQNCVNANWVDIEIEYFNSLMNCKKVLGGKPLAQFEIDKIDKLNKEFEYLKNHLYQYLQEIDSKKHDPSSLYSRILCQEIFRNEIVTLQLESDIRPNRIHILNFNYTSTINKYFNECNSKIPTEVNFIHGELKDSENPIIFGFGDEYNNDYKDFENHKINKLFPHIKSFGYFKTKNYHNLTRFINSDNFQVFIIGHSCGLSDRTMLKQIFEHEKCKSIKIFHHNGIDDFTEKTYDIARHFDNKGDMRLKIVPFNNLDSMPQCKNG